MLTILTLSTETIIPFRACSPVGSTQVNFGPKSQKIELITRINDVLKERKLYQIPKESTRLSSNKRNIIRVCPVVDLNLLVQSCSTEYHDLFLRYSNTWIRFIAHSPGTLWLDPPLFLVLPCLLDSLQARMHWARPILGVSLLHAIYRRLPLLERTVIETKLRDLTWCNGEPAYLRAQVLYGHWLRIEYRNWFYTSKNDVLSCYALYISFKVRGSWSHTDFSAQSFQPDNENVWDSHPFHC